MTYIPARVAGSCEGVSVAAWLEANGCRHYVSADDPVVIKGSRAYYVALIKKDTKSGRRAHIKDGSIVPLGVKSVHIRHPLRNFFQFN